MGNWSKGRFRNRALSVRFESLGEQIGAGRFLPLLEHKATKATLQIVVRRNEDLECPLS